MTKAFAIGLLALAVFTANAQTTLQVSGRLADTTGAAIAGATIRLIAPPDTLSTVSDDNGGFTFRKLKNRTFSLRITMKGYLPYTADFTISEYQASTRLENLVLRVNYKDLDPVIVSRPRPFVVSGDTVSYNTAAFPVREGAEVEDILKRLPGIEVDMDGNVIVQGKKVEKVMVNGKEFFGGDVLLAIRNLPADVVRQLQIIDDYGDKARLTGIKIGEPAKVLNIVFKPDKRNGLFGDVHAAAGTENKYDESAFANSIQGDRQLSLNGGVADNSQIGTDPTHHFDLSYADQWNSRWGGRLNGGVSGDNPRSASSSTQASSYPGEQLSQQQSGSSDGHNRSYNASGGLALKPDNSTLLRLSATFGVQESHQQAAANFTTADLDSGFSKTTKGQSLNTSTTHTVNWSTDLYYEKTMPLSRRRFSLQANASGADARSLLDNQTSTVIVANNVTTSSVLHYRTNNPFNGLNLNINASYYQPVSASSLLEIGYSGRSSATVNDRTTQSPDPVTGVLTTVDSLTSLQRYHSFIQHLRAGYLVKTGRLSLDLHLEGEQGVLSGTFDDKAGLYTYNYFNFLPGVQATWKLTPKQSVLFQYQGANIIPSLRQVSPVTDLTNPQYPVIGNPDLKASFVQSASIHYENTDLKATQYTNFGLGIGYTIVDHPIIPVTVHPKDSSQVIQSTTFINYGQNSNLNINYHLTLPAFIHKWFHVTTNGGLLRSQTQTLTDGLSYLTKTLRWNQSLHLQVLIPDKFESNFQGDYTISHSTSSSAMPVNTFTQAAAINVNIKYYFFTHWSQTVWLTQPYISAGNGLAPAPSSFTASLQREFLRHNRGTINITGYNLFNNKVMSSQSVSGTTISQSQTAYIGRYFLLTIILRLQRFN